MLLRRAESLPSRAELTDIDITGVRYPESIASPRMLPQLRNVGFFYSPTPRLLRAAVRNSMLSVRFPEHLRRPPKDRLWPELRLSRDSDCKRPIRGFEGVNSAIPTCGRGGNARQSPSREW